MRELACQSIPVSSPGHEGTVMMVVAVTACPTGVAHTYMAAKELEKTAKKLGYHIKVETQGAMGLENELSENDIAHADVAILAADVALEKPERFDRISIVRVSVRDAINDAAAVLARCDTAKKI